MCAITDPDSPAQWRGGRRLCGRCNRTKGNRDMAYLAERLAALSG